LSPSLPSIYRINCTKIECRAIIKNFDSLCIDYPSDGYPSDGYPSDDYPSDDYPSDDYPSVDYPSVDYFSIAYVNIDYCSVDDAWYLGVFMVFKGMVMLTR